MRARNPLLAPAGQVAIIALAVAAAYHRTLAVPFYFDDFSSIRDNPLIYHWRGLAPLWRFEPNRIVAYASFALNYRLGHFAPAGYHVVNLVVHTLVGVAVLGLGRGLVRTPGMRGMAATGPTGAWPLLAALLFVLHPLHTQAVTYVVQRLASMVALFYLTSLAAYVQARLARPGMARTAWIGLAIASGLLAFLTKENSATLPAAIALTEWLAFAPGPRRRLATLAGAVLALGFFYLTVVIGHAANPLSGGAAASLSQETRALSRGHYALTELIVIWHYVRLFLWPAGLHLDYDFPVRSSLARADVLLAAGAHFVLVAGAIALRRRAPLAAWGALFYELAHAVESSVIPIRDVVFEHRAYLPDAGLCLLLAGASAALATSPARARFVSTVACALLIALGAATYRRNETWRDPVAFWRGNIALAPAKARPWGMLGRVLLDAGRPAEAVAAIRQADRLRASAVTTDDAQKDAINMIWALRLLGRHEEALAWAARATAAPMPDALRASVAVNEGNVYFDQRRWAEAEAAFRRARALAPDYVPAITNLASTCAETGRYAEAERLLAAALAADPEDAVTRTNLWQARAQAEVVRGDSLRAAGRPGEAIAAYRRSLEALASLARDNPADPSARENAAKVDAMIQNLESRSR